VLSGIDVTWKELLAVSCTISFSGKNELILCFFFSPEQSARAFFSSVVYLGHGSLLRPFRTGLAPVSRLLRRCAGCWVICMLNERRTGGTERNRPRPTLQLAVHNTTEPDGRM